MQIKQNKCRLCNLCRIKEEGRNNTTTDLHSHTQQNMGIWIRNQIYNIQEEEEVVVVD